MELTREEQEKMQKAIARIELIRQSEKWAEGEIHHIANIVCYLRDADDNDPMKEKAEKMLQAWLVRKRLGIPVVFKQISEEFGCV